MKQLKPWLMLAGVATVLAACGGGSGDAAPAPASPLDAVPGGATQSIGGWLDYLNSLTKAPDAETREGVAVSAAGITGVPTDDTGEPIALAP